MNNKPLPWFRYYTETATDMKFTRIARECKISKAEAVGAWSIILCLAAQSPVRGKLYVTFQERFNETDISEALCCDETKAALLLGAFVRMEMMHQDGNGAWCISNWDKRQYEGDVSTDRVRKHREKQAMKREGNVPETPPDTESDTETESETEREDNRPPAPPPAKLYLNTQPVVIYRKVFGVEPNEQQARRMTAKVLNLEIWQKTCEHWNDHGWKANNIPGIFDLYDQAGVCKQCAASRASPGKNGKREMTEEEKLAERERLYPTYHAGDEIVKGIR